MDKRNLSTTDYERAIIRFPLGKEKMIALRPCSTNTATVNLMQTLETYYVRTKKEFRELHPDYTDKESMESLYYSTEPFIHEITVSLPRKISIGEFESTVRRHLRRYEVNKKAIVEFL